MTARADAHADHSRPPSSTARADYWLETQRFDRVSDARMTATWLRDRMEKTDDIFLLGNHDAAYMFPRSFTATVRASITTHHL